MLMTCHWIIYPEDWRDRKITLTYCICDWVVRLGVVFHQTFFVVYEKKHAKKGVETEMPRAAGSLSQRWSLKIVVLLGGGKKKKKKKQKIKLDSSQSWWHFGGLLGAEGCPLPPIHMLRPWSRGDGIWRWGLWPWWWSPDGWISTFRKSGQLALSASAKLAVCKAEKGHLQNPIVLASWSRASSLQTGSSTLLSFVGRPVLQQVELRWWPLTKWIWKCPRLSEAARS